MTQKPAWLLLSGLMLVLLAALGIPQLAAHQRFLAQGMEPAFPTPLADTGMPRACVNAALEQYDEARLPWALGMISEGGFGWVRQHFPWAEIEPQPGEFDWARWDRLVAGAVAEGLQLIPVLDTPPAWAGTPPDPQAFARFAGVFANHYSAQLVYYQIWHNPNLGETWGGQADPYAYAELLTYAAGAIRASDPDARIILGDLAPNVETGPVNYSETRFLELLAVAGALPSCDVVSVQPYGFYSGPEDRRVEPGLLNFSRPILVRRKLESLGAGDKALWAGQFGWNSLPPEWEGPPSVWGGVDEQTQAAYTVAALERAAQEWPWSGVMCLNNFQPRPVVEERATPSAEEHWGFALVGPEGSPRPVYEAVRAWAQRPQIAQPGVYPAGTEMARFTGMWRIGPLGADIGQSGDRVTLDFAGTGVALTVRRGPYRAFLFVTVDGKPAPALPRDEQGRAYVVLYDPLADVATVPLAEHLPYGQHTVEVTADRGWYQWSLVDWRVTHQPDPRPYTLGMVALGLLGVLGVTLVIVAGRRVDWTAAGTRWAAPVRQLSEPLRLGLTLATGCIFGLATWMTEVQGVFRRLGDGPGLAALLLAVGLCYFSPWLLLSLVSGVLLLFLVFIQPSMGLALTIAAAPLYLHPVSLFGKSFALSELMLLPTLAGGLLKGVSEWRAKGWQRPRVSIPFLLPVLAFVLVASLSTLGAAHRHEAFRELRLVVLEPVLFYLAVVAWPLTRRERWRVVDFFVLSAVGIALVGLAQYFCLGDVITAEGGARRLRSIYGSPNNVGLYLGRVWPLLLAVALWGQGHWNRAGRRLLYALAGAPVGLALLLSLSRGAIMLGIPAGLLALGLLAGGRWRKVTLVALCLFLVALIPLFRTPRFAALLDPGSGTTFLRLSLWRSAWAMFRDHPLLGVGPDNFLYAYRTRYVLPTAWEEFNLSHPHNWVLDFASRLGLLGLGAFLWLQAAFWRRAVPLARRAAPERRALVVGALASMAAALAHGLVDASYFYVDLAYVFFLTLAVVGWKEMSNEEMTNEEVCK